jgi:hypothetical protein
MAYRHDETRCFAVQATSRPGSAPFFDWRVAFFSGSEKLDGPPSSSAKEKSGFTARSGEFAPAASVGRTARPERDSPSFVIQIAFKLL